ncbi:uncharacterized protein LOC118267052 [Spodoptera frugiperda]|uniref:Uncharacterized protein LOC118267052 n=1 Tax=Spodoptera frugiperda TaxID=7108 RepID=A0A9R0D1A0_SPOFR|nr:uncharacterized protein LOC118267052 [Spodoptera frugiperda]
MGPKSGTTKTKSKTKSGVSASVSTDPTLLLESNDSLNAPRCISLSMVLQGASPVPGEYHFLAMFNGSTLVETKWLDEEVIMFIMPININDPHGINILANSPLILLMRLTGGKASKEPDPLIHPDNRYGASADLFPLLLGEQTVFLTSNLVSISTGEKTPYSVVVRAISPGTVDETVVPLTMTMISAHCLPPTRDGTAYISAIGLNGIHKPKAKPFNMSLSSDNAQRILFANASTGGYIAETAMNVHTDDKFMPSDLKSRDQKHCRHAYWNAMKRVLVEPGLLHARLSSPFTVEVAAVPRLGKVEVRGRYLALVDAKVLLEPGQIGVTVCSKLTLFSEANKFESTCNLLDLPATSAKASVRDGDQQVLDEYGHNSYIVIRFDLMEPLVPKTKLENLYDIMGFPLPKDADIPKDHSDSDIVHVDTVVDARTISKEAGALAVHKELSALACKGVIQMNQGIKRTAANRLLMRVRAVLKSFPPGDCSYLDWQDTVTAQHAACRRAVTASFAPQPPPLRPPSNVAAARCRIAGDNRIAAIHNETNYKIVGRHPRTLLTKSLRCLEEGKEEDAKNYLLDALSIQTRNRYLLWMYGGLEFDREDEGSVIAGAALRIAVKGDYSDGTANSIGWAALHAFHHVNGNPYAAFVSAKKMRKAFSLPLEWDKILARWTDTSGEEEIFWMPTVIATDNPLLIAAAFFLCLRCYRFSEALLECVDSECASSGSYSLKCETTPDVYYLRAAIMVLQRKLEAAINITTEGINKFGPTPVMSQMRATCMTRIRNWDRDCETAFRQAENAGSELCSSILYVASLKNFKQNPMEALQRVARAHRASPSGHTALLIGRIYAVMDKFWLAERWLAAAVDTEPLLADGWAMLAILAMYDKNLDKARVMLRTAKQVGPISPDIDAEVTKAMELVGLEKMSDFLVKNLCFCDYI